MNEKRKDWEIALGERSVDTGTTDSLLQETINASRAKGVKRQEEIDELAHEAKVAELKKKADSGNQSSSPVDFKIKYTVDLDEERKKREDELKQLRQEQENTVKAIGTENAQLRDKIQETQVELVRITLQAQMDSLGKMLEANAAKGDFEHQLAAAEATARKLGFMLPDKGSSGGDIMSQIKLKEIEMNNTIALRKMDEEAKDRDIDRRIAIAKIEDDREARKQAAAQQAKRDEYFARAPEIIGRAFAAAYLESKGTSVSAQPQSPQPRQPQPGIEAGVGEFGTAECSCGNNIAIGPTATEAVCAGCGTRYPISRLPSDVMVTPPPKGKRQGENQGPGSALMNIPEEEQ